MFRIGRWRRSTFTAAVVTAAAVMSGACGTPPGDTAGRAATTTEPAAGYPLTVDNCGRRETFTEPPRRVVILNGVSVSEVESFVELGLQRSVVANTQNYGVSDIPGMQDRIAALPTGGLTMNQNYGVPAEQLIAAKPDLVVSSYAGGFDAASGFATRDELDRLGIHTIVSPANCANGDPTATAAEKHAYDTAGVTAGFAFLTLLGRIFAVPGRAAAVVSGQQASLARVAAAVAPAAPVPGLVASPGSTPEVPFVWTGGIFDDVLRRAGVTNAFGGRPRETTVSAEQLAKADVNVLVLFVDASVDAPAAAAGIFAAYPNWAASKARRYVVVHDGMYFGPAAVDGVEKVARAAHPGSF